VVYRAAAGESDVPTLALVDRLTGDDLRACAARVASWHDSGLATPLLLPTQEFRRALDVFPFEFGAIIAEHAVVAGPDPFEGLQVDAAHLRQACEVQARSHLLHLREGYLESRGRGDAIADLIVRSSVPLAALVHSVARLHGERPSDGASAAAAVEGGVGLPHGSLGSVIALSSGRPLSGDEARGAFHHHLDAVQRLVDYIDQWGGR
jgi:hypothetical protein